MCRLLPVVRRRAEGRTKWQNVVAIAFLVECATSQCVPTGNSVNVRTALRRRRGGGVWRRLFFVFDRNDRHVDLLMIRQGDVSPVDSMGYQPKLGTKASTM